MADVIRRLPAYARQNVEYIDENGDTYANRPHLLDLLSKPLPPDAEGRSRAMMPSGDIITFPKQLSKAQFQAAQRTQTNDLLPSGSAARAFGLNPELLPHSAPETPGNNGTWFGAYSRNDASGDSATVILPTSVTYPNNNAPGKNPNADDYYIYLGGWGSGYYGAPIDAGLMNLNSNNDVNKPSQWYDWEMVINNGVGYTYGLLFTPGERVNMQFMCDKKGYVALIAEGFPASGPPTSDTIVDHDSAIGWVFCGCGCTVKMLTSLAQKKTASGDGASISTVQWSNCQILIPVLCKKSQTYFTWTSQYSNKKLPYYHSGNWVYSTPFSPTAFSVSDTN